MALLVGAAVFFAVSVWEWWLTWSFVRDAVQAEGVIVEVKETGGEGTSYAPVFRFRDSTGTEYQVQSDLSTPSPAYKVGDTVEILYLSYWPQFARIKSPTFLWGGTQVILVVSIFFALAGIFRLRG
jgi:uncharacterized protein DUF3592